jgi:hypothetical protein
VRVPVSFGELQPVDAASGIFGRITVAVIVHSDEFNSHQRNRFTVTHSCYHETRVEAFTVHEIHNPTRQRLHRHLANQPCLKCRLLVAVKPQPEIALPVYSAHAGPGMLRTERGVPLFFPDHKVIVHREYLYATDVLDPNDAGPLEVLQTFTYTPSMWSWINEYIIGGILAPVGDLSNNYLLGQSFRTEDQFTEAERRRGND